jgi:hypothetical protein
VRSVIFVLLFFAFGCQNEPAEKKRGPPSPEVVTLGKVTTDAMHVERRYQ